MAELANYSVVEYVFKHKQNHVLEGLYEGELRISILQQIPSRQTNVKTIK